MQRRKAGPQGMVFGGIMAGLILLCALVPFLSIFMPVPLVLVYVRYGGRTATMTAIVASLLTAMFMGVVQAFLFTVPFGIAPGLAFGYGFRHKRRPIQIGIIAMLTFFLAWSANYVVTRTLVLGGQDPIEQAMESQESKEAIGKLVGFFERTLEQAPPRDEAAKQARDASIAQMRQWGENPAALYWSLLPSMLIMGGAVNTWLNYMLCRFTLPRFGHDVPAPTPFSRFTLPVWTVWVFALFYLPSLYAAQSLLNAPWWAKMLFNLGTVLQAVFMLYGLAVAYGYFRMNQAMGKLGAVMWSVVPLLFLGVYGPVIYSMVGMADAIFDFRGLGHGLLRRPPEETP
ncbi:MAG: hypothetical protein K0R39_702 [Symbiobacteriaceae bacterium]|jgi:uncharacterized protein YybS (DUF2232 family)|nr:hypothetical protein [Symbiobacteriaceae bacterium]